MFEQEPAGARSDARRDALVEKIFADSIAFMELLGVYIGDKLGLYAAMSGGGWMTPARLAAAETGTVMRTKTLESYAKEAGFSGVEVLPVESDMWRFYRLLA